MPNHADGLRKVRDAIIAYVEAGNELVKTKYVDRCGKRYCAVGVAIREAGGELDYDYGGNLQPIESDTYDVVQKWRTLLDRVFGLPTREFEILQAVNDGRDFDLSPRYTEYARHDVGAVQGQAKNVIAYLNQRIHDVEAGVAVE